MTDKPFWEKRLEYIQKAPFNHIRDRVSIHTEQYKEWGFDDSDIWDLSDHLAALILPRLKRYKEMATNVIKIDFPLDEMIEGFDLYVNKSYIDWTEEEAEKVNRGLKVFGEHFHELWY